ncbi:MAG: restriction endonuclease subunit S [Finegoldia magna]|uniref:restriction endonuclease subunit S n=1 Tax=Finegoldia magna TaxID=1260 RepID=UPI000B918AAC|nr:restriction endonuclease subunit S [Finegoldia magna]OXZ31948.1 hypothetical protein B9N57_00215 [Finegoldia magna]
MTRKMKDSGIEWIGEIPEDWDVVRNKNIFNRKKEIIENEWKNTQLLSLTTKGIIKKDISILEGKLPESFSTYQFVNKGDLVLCLFDLDMSAVFNGYCQYDGMISPAYKRYVLKAEGDLRYYNYLFDFIFDKRKYKIYSTTLRFTLDNQEFDRIPTIKPNLKQQIEIANFLDRKTKQIEDIKNTIKNEIETIENYKKSVITEAITKGLDKNVEMKDSGIEWIGEIPKHWEVSKIKYNMKRMEKKNPGDKEVLSVYREYGVIPKDSRDDNHNVTSMDTSNYKYVKPGYFVINKMKAWQGSMGVSQYEGIVSPAYYIYIFINRNIEPFYIHHLFRIVYPNEFKRISGGIREGQWDLSANLFKNTFMTIPPLNEQNQIVDYLDKKTKLIDDSIAIKQKQLETLEKYKKSLIYEYVTGKKEVKDGEET